MGDVQPQGQNPFLDSPGGGLQDQMTQAPFGASVTIQAGSGAAAAAGTSLGVLLPVAAAAHRRVFGKRNLTPGVPGMSPFTSVG